MATFTGCGSCDRLILKPDDHEQSCPHYPQLFVPVEIPPGFLSGTPARQPIQPPQDSKD